MFIEQNRIPVNAQIMITSTTYPHPIYLFIYVSSRFSVFSVLFSENVLLINVISYNQWDFILKGNYFFKFTKKKPSEIKVKKC